MASKLDVVKHTRSEKKKYEKIWEHNDYRRWAPGEHFFEQAYDSFEALPGDTLCDWGIGTGRAAKMFQDKGLIVEGVDIARNAVSEFLGVVHYGPIWNPPIPKGTKYSFGYCTDVMEHIHPKLVLESLKAIKKHTTIECFFSIATFDDSMGAMIGQQLHQCVRPPAWWAASFARVFKSFKFTSSEKYCIIRASC